ADRGAVAPVEGTEGLGRQRGHGSILPSRTVLHSRSGTRAFPIRGSRGSGRPRPRHDPDMLSPDPAAVRAALERQLSLLVPVADRLGFLSPAVVPGCRDGWRGPAADAFASAEADVADLIRLAAAEARDTVHRVRSALALLP